MAYVRKIKEAYDRISKKTYRADEIFKNTKDAFRIRDQYHNNEFDFICPECGQKIIVSYSKLDKVYFQHNSSPIPCFLKDEQHSEHEAEIIYNIHRSKESPRHKHLKNYIARKLSMLDDVTSIHVDDRFIFDGEDRRKPDVYCKYQDKELVFEIQLSELSLRYILNRYKFYKKKGIYLIWVLDNFDVNGQSQTERDIKYLTEYENFFRIDEDSDDFRLLCKYKSPYLNDKNELRTPWTEKSINLKEVKFDSDIFQIYYFNYVQKRIEKENERTRIEERINKEKQKKAELEQKENANIKCGEILERLRTAWKKDYYNYDEIGQDIRDLDDFGKELLNKSNAFKPINGEPRLHYWFKIAKRKHWSFLGFMLNCIQLEFNVNTKSKDGKTLLHTLIIDSVVDDKENLFKSILKRGYVFQEEDEMLIHYIYPEPKECEKKIFLCQLSNKLFHHYLVDRLFDHENVIFTIESAKRNEIFGFNYKPDEWKALANNAIHSYKKYWFYIEQAFKYYGIWEKLIKLDKNGSFRKKVENHYDTEDITVITNRDILITELYPELPAERIQLEEYIYPTKST